MLRSLKKLLSWWRHLSDVDRASTVNISHLVVSAEAIITEELTGWVSTAKKDELRTDQEDQEDTQHADASKADGASRRGKGQQNKIAPVLSGKKLKTLPRRRGQAGF